jgi:hypothetical protein
MCRRRQNPQLECRDKGHKEKGKGKSLRKKSKVVSAAPLPSSFCPLPF